MTTPGFTARIPAARPAGDDLGNRVAARIAFLIGTYRPGRLAARLGCPILFCLCDGDSLAPAKRSAKLGAKAPRAEIKRYPGGHFEIYVGEPFEQAVADQTDFLVRHLGAGERSAQPNGIGSSTPRIRPTTETVRP